ncbi:MAG: RloB family protein [Armatimonadota bacterium]
MPRPRPTERNPRGYRDRRVNQIPVRNRFLIVCEGERTEPNYFRRFRVPSQVIEVCGVGCNTVSLVRKAIRLREEKGYTGGDDQVWCVFDRDSFLKAQFNRAITLADEHDLQVAYSNEAFELWYLLHFHYFNTGITRDQYIEKLHALLGQHCGRAYAKNSADMFDLLYTRLPDAMRNAANLLQAMDGVKAGDANPSTTVHRLVAELRRFEI